MRFIIVILSTFGLLSIYKIGIEIVQTNAQSGGGLSLPYNFAGAFGEAMGMSILVIPIIIVIYYFMTKTKKDEVLEKKYPVNFIITTLVIIGLVIGLNIFGSMSMQSNEVKASSITKVQNIPQKAIYSEISKKGIEKSVLDFVDGTNRVVKRNHGFIQIDEITRQQYSQANKNIAIQRYLINKNGLLKIYSEQSTDLKQITNFVKNTVKEQNINAMCSVKAINIFMEKGMEMEFLYQFDDGTFMTSFIIKHSDCPK